MGVPGCAGMPGPRRCGHRARCWSVDRDRHRDRDRDRERDEAGVRAVSRRWWCEDAGGGAWVVAGCGPRQGIGDFGAWGGAEMRVVPGRGWCRCVGGAGTGRCRGAGGGGVRDVRPRGGPRRGVGGGGRGRCRGSGVVCVRPGAGVRAEGALGVPGCRHLARHRGADGCRGRRVRGAGRAWVRVVRRRGRAGAGARPGHRRCRARGGAGTRAAPGVGAGAAGRRAASGIRHGMPAPAVGGGPDGRGWVRPSCRGGRPGRRRSRRRSLRCPASPGRCGRRRPPAAG
ncbi:hypothetical protein KPP03845_106554 [Streptomyces xanthophaeus]|nr:hypothetical protein KPP03845_106554 [Streptomyces xanthophaeus]